MRRRSQEGWDQDVAGYTEQEFFQNFRTWRNAFHHMSAPLPETFKRRRRSGDHLLEEVGVGLYWVATGAGYRTLANLFGIAKSSVCAVEAPAYPRGGVRSRGTRRDPILMQPCTPDSSQGTAVFGTGGAAQLVLWWLMWTLISVWGLHALLLCVISHVLLHYFLLRLRPQQSSSFPDWLVWKRRNVMRTCFWCQLDQTCASEAVGPQNWSESGSESLVSCWREQEEGHLVVLQLLSCKHSSLFPEKETVQSTLSVILTSAGKTLTFWIKTCWRCDSKQEVTVNLWMLLSVQSFCSHMNFTFIIFLKSGASSLFLMRLFVSSLSVMIRLSCCFCFSFIFIWVSVLFLCLSFSPDLSLFQFISSLFHIFSSSPGLVP